MSSSFEKWPTEIQITQVSSSVLGKEFNLYFVTGMMSQAQRNTLEENMPILSEFAIEPDKIVISTLISENKLMEVYEAFSPLAKEWRGQYYVLTNKFVEACKKFFESD